MTISSEQKSLLRDLIKNDRKNLPDDYKTQAETIICNNFLSYLGRIKHKPIIGLYYPINNELDIAPLVKNLPNQRYKCSLPKLKSDHSSMDFYEWTPNVEMVKNTFGFLEPKDTEKTMPNIIIIPLLTCDYKGNRLGYGKGFYDKYLSSHKNIIKVGFCYERLLSKEVLPVEDHDQKIDIIFTEVQTINAS